MEQNLTDIWNQKKSAKNLTSLSLEGIKQVFDSFYEALTVQVTENLPVDKNITKILPPLRMILSERNIKVCSILVNQLMMQIAQKEFTFRPFAKP